MTVLEESLCDEPAEAEAAEEDACLGRAFCCCCGREMRGWRLPNGALHDKVSRAASGGYGSGTYRLIPSLFFFAISACCSSVYVTGALEMTLPPSEEPPPRRLPYRLKPTFLVAEPAI